MIQVREPVGAIRGRTAVVVLGALGLFVSIDAQPAPRRATNVAALVAYPDYYHARSILIVGKVESRQNGDIVVSDGGTSLRVVTKVATPDGLDEIRGEFWDIGRMKPDDPRLAAYDVRSTFHFDPQTAWPRPGEVTAILATAVSPAAYPLAPSIRSIVLNPGRYLSQRVTITGQYSGRNLAGELPDAPARSRYDFVLRSADAAIWITNTPPKGKDFSLELDARVDTGRWLQVSGTVQQGRGLQWLDADAGSLVLVKAPAETAVDERDGPIRIPAAPPAEVVFSTPTEDESDVSPKTNIRIQFSREINPTSLKGRVGVGYLDSQGVERSGPMTPAPDFSVQYTTAVRVLELRFNRPLEQFRRVKVTLLDGIVGRDGQPVKPWTLTFTLGGL